LARSGAARRGLLNKTSQSANGSCPLFRGHPAARCGEALPFERRLFVQPDLSMHHVSADHKGMAKSMRVSAGDLARESEPSEIRARAEMVTRNERQNSKGSDPPNSWTPGSEREPSSGELGAGEAPESRRSVRIAQKISRAEGLFRHLSDDDPRARLLRVAMLRNDEVLLDALLRRLESLPPRREGG
jgi:hypothetical protein